jgi:hypothetical protein
MTEQRPERDVLEEQLADYLAGELSVEQHAAVEQRLRNDPALAQRVGQMREALGLMQRAWPVVAAEPSALEFRVPVRSSRPARWPWHGVGYTLAAGLAFAAGMWTARVPSEIAPPPPPAPAWSSAASLANDPRLEAALRTAPAEAGFTRSVLVLAALAQPTTSRSER